MRDSWLLRALERLELFLYRQAALVVSVTHSFRENLRARGIDPAKVAVVTNGVDIARFSPRPKDEALVRGLGLEGKFVAGYVGTHGMAHALETLLDAGEAPARTFPRSASSCSATAPARVAGRGARIARPRQRRLRRLGAEGRGRALLVAARRLDHPPAPTRRCSRPSSPRSCSSAWGWESRCWHGVAGESAAIVEREGAGWVFDRRTPAALATLVRRVRGDPAELARCRGALPRRRAALRPASARPRHARRARRVARPGWVTAGRRRARRESAQTMRALKASRDARWRRGAPRRRSRP